MLMSEKGCLVIRVNLIKHVSWEDLKGVGCSEDFETKVRIVSTSSGTGDT